VRYDWCALPAPLLHWCALTAPLVARCSLFLSNLSRLQRAYGEEEYLGRFVYDSKQHMLFHLTDSDFRTEMRAILNYHISRTRVLLRQEDSLDDYVHFSTDVRQQLSADGGEVLALEGGETPAGLDTPAGEEGLDSPGGGRRRGATRRRAEMEQRKLAQQHDKTARDGELKREQREQQEQRRREKRLLSRQKHLGSHHPHLYYGAKGPAGAGGSSKKKRKEKKDKHDGDGGFGENEQGFEDGAGAYGGAGAGGSTGAGSKAGASAGADRSAAQIQRIRRGTAGARTKLKREGQLKHGQANGEPQPRHADPQVGWEIEILWPDDGTYTFEPLQLTMPQASILTLLLFRLLVGIYYPASVTRYFAFSSKHEVRYGADNSTETLDFAKRGPQGVKWRRRA
jgi:hypothetical protein